MIIFDIEANGKELYNVTEVHCICTYNTITQESRSYYHDNLLDGVNLLSKASILCGHNIIGYDLLVLEKIFKGFTYSGELVDTYILSTLINPDRHNGHSIESYGLQFGIPKDTFSKFDTFSFELLSRCERDVELNYKVYQYLEPYLKDYDWSTAIMIENKMSRLFAEQAYHGVYFNKKLAYDTLENISSKVKELGAYITSELDFIIPKSYKPKDGKTPTVVSAFKKDGEYTVAAKKWMGKDIFQVVGDFSRVSFMKPELSQQQLIAEQFIKKWGWKPKSKSPTGQPSLKRETLINDPNPVIKAYGTYSRLNYYKKLLKNDPDMGFLNKIRDDNRLSAGGISNGTPTGRARHTIVVNIPTEREDSEYSKIFRQLFTTPKGKIMVGADLKSIEARMLCHYMEDPVYTDHTCNKDIHAYTAELIGSDSRQKGKEWNYALLYGAGNKKLGSILGVSSEKAKEIREQFMEKLPKFKRLLDIINMKLEYQQYIKGIDGRQLFIRSTHSSLNSLLQSSASILMKLITIYVNEDITRNKLDVTMVIHMHDEFIFECNPCDVEKLKIIIKNAVDKASKFFKIEDVPIEMDIKIGETWRDVH